MKKILVAVVLATMLIAPGASAQTVAADADLQVQLRTLEQQLINLLIAKIAELQKQLAELQAMQAQAQGLPYSLPVWPQALAQATNKSVQEDGTVSPSLILQPRARRNYRNPASVFSREVLPPVGSDTITLSRGATDWLADDNLEVLVSVGNPDQNFNPGWSCEGFGAWSGSIEPYDHWEKVEPIAAGTYGVRCAGSEASFNVIIK